MRYRAWRKTNESPTVWTVTARETIAGNIRSLAEQRGMSLDALADFAGVSRRQLYSFLSGEKDATIGWLEKIASALDVDLGDLFKDA